MFISQKELDSAIFWAVAFIFSLGIVTGAFGYWVCVHFDLDVSISQASE